MPDYTYYCKHCEREFEASQRISEPRGADCPHCQRRSDNRLIAGGTGFTLRGSGWYKDGY